MSNSSEVLPPQNCQLIFIDTSRRWRLRAHSVDRSPNDQEQTVRGDQGAKVFRFDDDPPRSKLQSFSGYS